ncbi:hypothetical protein N665_0013s0030 [Sinapis alba]|nr:hypothetical protein N665_0013s0030 [Sinapis alba]
MLLRKNKGHIRLTKNLTGEPYFLLGNKDNIVLTSIISLVKFIIYSYILRSHNV